MWLSTRSGGGSWLRVAVAGRIRGLLTGSNPTLERAVGPRQVTGNPLAPRRPRRHRHGRPAMRSPASLAIAVSLRLLSRVASPAKSSSNPTSTASSAGASSPTSKGRSVWGGSERAAATGERVPGIGLRGTGAKTGDAAHRQSEQIRHLVPARAGDRGRQRPDRGRLVHHDQQRTVLGRFVAQDPQLGFGVGHRPVVQPLTIWVETTA